MFRCAVKPSFFIALLTLFFAANREVQAAPKISPKSLIKAGAKISECPQFVGYLRSGSFSPISSTAICGTNFNKVKKLKATKIQLPLSNLAQRGSAFAAIAEQQGPTTTEVFSVQNYPAIISYELRGTGGALKIELLNDKGKRVESLLDIRGENSGSFALNLRGRFSLKVTPSASGKDAEQPTYSLSMGFMDQYEGFSLSTRDLADASVKTIDCPKSILDSSASAIIDLPSGTVCMKKDPSDSGMTPTPFNLATGLFLTNSLLLDGSGATRSLPFRVTPSSRLTYSVEDPSPGGKGLFKMNLIEMGSGKKTTLFNLRGAVSNGSTALNQKSGDYYLEIEVKSFDAAKNGELSYTVSVE